MGAASGPAGGNANAVLCTALGGGCLTLRADRIVVAGSLGPDGQASPCAWDLAGGGASGGGRASGGWHRRGEGAG